MATASAPGPTRKQLETALIEKCWKDPGFKREVVGDPKGTLQRHLGQHLPDQVKIFIHEEDANTLHFSIPPAPSNLAELSDEDLERVAGGTDVIGTLLVSAQVLITAALGGAIGISIGGAVGSVAGGAVAGANKGWG